MKYLFIGAHTDEEICFAGTMAKLAEEGHHVQFLPMSWCGVEDLKDECLASSKILGIHLWVNNFIVREFHKDANLVADYFYGLKEYDFIFTHSKNDIHPDHRTIGEESKRIFSQNLITYIGPWNGNENPNYFVEISGAQLEKKLHALACYKSQTHRPYMNPDFIRAQAIYNGVKCGKRYAEAFRIERLIN